MSTPLTRAELRDAFGDCSPGDRLRLGRWLRRCGWKLSPRTLLWSSSLLSIAEQELLQAVDTQAAVEVACQASQHETPLA